MLDFGIITVPTPTSIRAPQDPSLTDTILTVRVTSNVDWGTMIDLTMTRSPFKHSLTSRTKKSTLGFPIPILTIDTGTPLYLPVIVRNPRSVPSLNGLGEVSKHKAIRSAREGAPTVICMG